MQLSNDSWTLYHYAQVSDHDKARPMIPSIWRNPPLSTVHSQLNYGWAKGQETAKGA